MTAEPSTVGREHWTHEGDVQHREGREEPQDPVQRDLPV